MFCSHISFSLKVIPVNPAASVRGPKHVVSKGKTLVLDPSEARQLLDSISAETIVGLRDRALIGVLLFSFARVGAALAMNVEDVYSQECRTSARVGIQFLSFDDLRPS